MARPAGAGSWLRVLATRARVPGRLIFAKQMPELLFGIRRCLWLLGALPQTLVWDRQSGQHAGGGRPTEAFASFCGQLKVDWHFCDAGDPQAKGAVERLQAFIETSFEPGRRFANELDSQAQLDRWFDERANPRMHKTLRCRPSDRLIEERQLVAPLPQAPPDTDRRWVLRVPPDPYLRFDSCDYSLEPALVGRRIEARVTEREVLAVALDTGELACRHARSFAARRPRPGLSPRAFSSSGATALRGAFGTPASGRSPGALSRETLGFRGRGRRSPDPPALWPSHRYERRRLAAAPSRARVRSATRGRPASCRYGSMFWFRRKKFVGSYARLTSTKRW